MMTTGATAAAVRGMTNGGGGGGGDDNEEAAAAGVTVGLVSYVSGTDDKMTATAAAIASSSQPEQITDESSYSSSMSTTTHQASRRRKLWFPPLVPTPPPEDDIVIAPPTSTRKDPASPPPPPTTPPTSYWQRITYDNFESGWGTFTEVDNAEDTKDAILISSATHPNQGQWIPNGTAALRIRFNLFADSSVFQETSSDVSTYDTLKVAFKYMTRGMENGDTFFVDYSSSIGADDWTEVEEFTWAGNDVPYTGVVTFNKDVGTTHARIRFRCNADTKQDFVYIDNVEFSGH